MAYQYLEYSFPQSQLFHKELIWANDNFSCYFAFKLLDTDDWTFFSGKNDTSHALESGLLLTSYGTSEAQAATNYLTTTKDSNNKIVALLPINFQAKYARIYVAEGSSVTIHEWHPSTYFTAHEIVSGTLEITDQLSDAPIIKVTASSVDRIKIGKVGAAYGIFGYDGTATKVFELSDSALTVAGWTMNATYLAKDTGTANTSSGMAPTDYPFYAGATYANRATAPFRITPAGALTATSATIVGDYKTSATVGTTQGVHLDVADNELYFYGDPTGAGTSIEKLVSIGMNPDGSDYYLIVAGTEDSTRAPILAICKNTVSLTGRAYLTEESSAVSLKTLMQPNLSADALTGVGIGAQIVAWRNVAAESYRLGEITAGDIFYGHRSTLHTSAVTDIVHGLWLHSYGSKGTISTLYDIRIAAAAPGGTITTHYAISQEDAAAINYFAGYSLATGGIRVGTTATDPGDNNLYVEGTTTLAGVVTLCNGLNYIGDTANAFMTVGLTINQGAADNEIISLKSSDVGHGMTSYVETDTYGNITKAMSTTGGIALRGYSEDKYGLIIAGYATNADTTTSTAAIGAVNTMSFKKSGTAGDLFGADDNLLCVSNMDSTQFIVKGDGDIYYNGADQGAYDVYDDALACQDLSMNLSNQLGKVLKYNKQKFHEMGVIEHTVHENGKEDVFVSRKGMDMLQLGAIGELYRVCTNLCGKLGITFEEAKKL